jgi:hypothetical protein
MLEENESPLGLQADYPGALSPSSLPPRLVTLEAQPDPDPQGNELVTSAHVQHQCLSVLATLTYGQGNC